MPTKTIKEILIKRDGLSPDEADKLIDQTKDDFYERLSTGEMPYDICMEWFGLEPDYTEELMG